MLARLNATGKGGSVKLASGGGVQEEGQMRRVRGQKYGYAQSSTVRAVFGLHLRLSCSDECLCVACFCKVPRIRTDDDPQGPGKFLPLHFLESLLQFFLGRLAKPRWPS